MSDNNSDTEDQQRTTDLKIQDVLPVTAVGIESQRERKNFSDLPPQNYVHTWFARRPTAATRLAVLSSILPEGYDENEMLRLIGMDPSNLPDLPDGERDIADHVVKKKNVKEQEGTDGRVYEHYGYRKAYKHPPSEADIKRLHETLKETWGRVPTVMDATAGGGAIPLESIRYGLNTHANELNSVAVAILHGVLEAPYTERDLSNAIENYGNRINQQVHEEIGHLFPDPEHGNHLERICAHTVECPNCGADLPLAPNWWLDRDEGIAVQPHYSEAEDNEPGEFTSFEIVNAETTSFNPTDGTVSYGDASCYCGWTIESEEIKQQAQSEDGFGERVIAIIAKDDSGQRFVTPSDSEQEAIEEARKAVAEGPQELSTLLNTDIPSGEKTDELRRNGMVEWRDLYTDRQLLVHYHYWKAFENIKQEVREEYDDNEAQAILTYLAFAASKSLSYNSKQSIWHPARATVANAFNRHDFAFSWSFAESNLLAEESGYNWVLDSIVEAYEEFRELSSDRMGEVTVTQGDAANLEHIDDGEIDALVVDPPYYQNVMYAELSDYFYVWLRKYLGDVYPGQFESKLTNKSNQAVARQSDFDDNGKDLSKRELAKRDYEQKMADIFDELRRVLADDGVFTLMFTHKQTDAWDSLTKALVDAGFKVTATHPVNTEAPLALNQADNNSVESTILLTSETRDQEDQTPALWEDVKRQARERAYEAARQYEERSRGDDEEFSNFVELTIAVYGPTLEMLTEQAPVRTSAGEEVQPEEVLDEARDAITAYIVDNYMIDELRHVDDTTRWYLILWLAFGTRDVPSDEAMNLAKAMDVDFDDAKDRRIWKKGGAPDGEIRLRPYDDRVHSPEADGRIYEPIDASQMQFDSTIDAVHATLWHYEEHGVDSAQQFIRERNLDTNSTYRAVLTQLANLLPTGDAGNFDNGPVLKEMLTSRLTSPGGPLDSINVKFSDQTAEGTEQATLTDSAPQDDDD
jgi:putative DNA methylase